MGLVTNVPHSDKSERVEIPPEQLRILPGEDPDELIATARRDHRPVFSYCLFSGGDDSTVLAHRCRDDYDQLAFVDTGTALPGVREFVGKFAAWLGKPLRILEHDDDPYRRIVLGGVHPKSGVEKQPLGFPGPAQHTRCYVDLKERQLERLLRETKTAHARNARVMYLTGVRRGESQRRRGRAPITRRGGAVFVNPLIDWSNAQMYRYRREHELPQSDVAALLHRSGECNCGAFAAPGEREDLQLFFPEWFEERIGSLEREAEALGLPCARWGAGHGQPTPEEVGALCSDCQLRIVALDEEDRRVA